MVRATCEYEDLAQRGYRFALSLTHNTDRAEDLLQDAWFALLKREGPWSAAYLFTTIRNRFIDEYRRSVRHDPEPFETCEEQGDPDNSTDEPLVIANGNLEHALERLSAEERAVLYLSGVERCSAQAIAELLQWPRGTVLGMIRRAKGKLRSALQVSTGVSP